MLCSPDKCAVRACCCGLCSLKTGCIVIGSIQILMALIIGIQNLHALIVYIDIPRVVASTTLDVLFAIIIILLGVVLILGAQKERRAYIKIWFYSTFVMVILEFLIGIAGFILGYNWLDVLPNFILVAVCIYFLIVVRSYFLVLQGDIVPTSA